MSRIYGFRHPVAVQTVVGSFYISVQSLNFKALSPGLRITNDFVAFSSYPLFKGRWK